MTVSDVVGLLHPGEMGAVVGGLLRAAGHTVLWASEGRSAATRARAEAAGLEDAGSVADVARRAAVILSICPPHAALRHRPDGDAVRRHLRRCQRRVPCDRARRRRRGRARWWRPLRRRRHRRPAAHDRGDQPALPLGRRCRRGRGALRRHVARGGRRRRRRRRGVGAEDGLRGVDEGHRRHVAGRRRDRPRRGRRGGSARRVDPLAARAGRPARAGPAERRRPRDGDGSRRWRRSRSRSRPPDSPTASIGPLPTSTGDGPGRRRPRRW